MLILLRGLKFFMFKWFIDISGFENILQSYSTSFSLGDGAYIIQKLDSNNRPYYCFTSVHFNTLISVEDVKNKSKEMINLFVGAASLVEGRILRFLLNGYVKEFNPNDYYISLEAKDFWAKCPINQLIKTSWGDSDLTYILHIVGSSFQQSLDGISYNRLYVTYEIVKRRWGQKKLYKFAEKSFWDDFRRTVQDFNILEAQVRHGTFSYQSILNPISKEDAISEVILACREWIIDDFGIALSSYNSFPRLDLSD